MNQSSYSSPLQPKRLPNPMTTPLQFITLLFCLSLTNIDPSQAFTLPAPKKHTLSSSPITNTIPIIQRMMAPNHNLYPFPNTKTHLSSSSSSSDPKPPRYQPPEAEATPSTTTPDPTITTTTTPTNQPPFPKVGDTVLYYELDGGNPTAITKVGKLTFLQRSSLESCGYIAEITELDDLGDGYYAEYPSRKRRSVRSLRPLTDLRPTIASFVRTEEAFKIPWDPVSQTPRATWETGYTLKGWEGPVPVDIDTDVVESDAELYNTLKIGLLKYAALAGVAGTAIGGLTYGLEDALVYAAGAVAGVGYLFFLGIKTDTLGSPDAKFGKNIANFRFLLPILVLVGVSVRNQAIGLELDGGGGLFKLVTTEQFCAAMLGFLTYRIPLFLSQLAPLVGESAGSMLPGSAGVALDLVKDAQDSKVSAGKGGLVSDDEGLTTVLVVSGPRGTGKTSLVTKFLEGGGDGVVDGGRFVEPRRLDRIADPMVWDRAEGRGDILDVDETGRYGLTKDGIFTAAESATSESDDENDTKQNVVVLDASVSLVKQLTQISGLRIIGVWVGLDSLDKFEARIQKEIEDGRLVVEDDETVESTVRAKIREVVSDIEYGLVSGVFEFTILNDEFENSLKELKNAAAYCFK